MKSSILISPTSSSKLLNAFLGEIDPYVRLMERHRDYLIKRYPNQHLANVFNTLPVKLLTIGPMALCDYLSLDLHYRCPTDVLAAIGLCCLQISSHDDVVDETPSKQTDLAALVYAGNLAALEGIQLLLKNKRTHIAILLSSLVNQNHYLQQWRVEKLWDKKPKNFSAYQDGVKDGVLLMEIGLQPALALCRAFKFKPQITDFAKSYALILQLIDDIRETKEDEAQGYHSFPILEGYPYRKSWEMVERHIEICQKTLMPSWLKMNSLINNLQKLISTLRKQYL